MPEIDPGTRCPDLSCIPTGDLNRRVCVWLLIHQLLRCVSEVSIPPTYFYAKLAWYNKLGSCSHVHSVSPVLYWLSTELLRLTTLTFEEKKSRRLKEIIHKNGLPWCIDPRPAEDVIVQRRCSRLSSSIWPLSWFPIIFIPIHFRKFSTYRCLLNLIDGGSIKKPGQRSGEKSSKPSSSHLVVTNYTTKWEITYQLSGMRRPENSLSRDRLTAAISKRTIEMVFRLVPLETFIRQISTSTLLLPSSRQTILSHFC